MARIHRENPRSYLGLEDLDCSEASDLLNRTLYKLDVFAGSGIRASVKIISLFITDIQTTLYVATELYSMATQLCLSRGIGTRPGVALGVLRSKTLAGEV